MNSNGKSTINSFWILVLAGLSIMFFVACQPAEDLKREKKFNPESRALLERQKTEQRSADEDSYKKLSKALLESHEIFQQVFSVVWDSKNIRVNSVFRQVERILNNPNGKFRVVNAAEPERSASCEGVEYHMVSRDAQYFIQEVDCRTQPTLKRDLMSIYKIKDNHYRWEFFTRNLPSGVGLSLSIVGDNIFCDLETDADGEIKRQRCKGLGQTHQGENYCVFTKYEFTRGAQKLMLVEGNKFSGIGRVHSTFQLPIPIEGVIQYSEKVEVQEPQPVAAGVAVADENAAQPAVQSAEAAKTESSKPVSDDNSTNTEDGNADTQEPQADSFAQCSDEDKQEILRMGLLPESIDENCELKEDAAQAVDSY